MAKIKERILNNLLLAGTVDSVFSGAVGREAVLRWYVRKMREIDSIRDYDEFAALIREMTERKYDFFCPASRYEDTNFYGYYHEILQYSGYKKRHYPILTGIEHGIRFGTARWPYFDYNICYICQGEERIHEIREENPYMPVLAIGPYIHYARQYYSDEMIAETRKKNGRTLLVFPGHTCEWNPDKGENNILDIVYGRYAGDYDTIMVCTYWRDLDSDEVKQFRDRGAKIVSAGFREDENFIRRLKTIISLADTVISNDIGTNMGFSIFLRKPFILEGICQVNPKDELWTAYYRELYDAFSLKGKSAFSEEQKQKQKDIYERFWGESHIKTAGELYGVLAVIDKLIRSAHFHPDKMHSILRDNGKLEKILNGEEREVLKTMITGGKTESAV